MAYLHIYFNDALKSVYELKSPLTTVGRAKDNDVVIDNPGVSAHHAEILFKDETYVIEDMASRNGIFVNGKRVDHQLLKYGDTITIFKHTLKLSAISVQETPAPSVSTDTHEIAQGATVMVNVANLGELLQERQNNSAYLLQMNGHPAGKRLMLNKVTFSFGRSRDNDLALGGWFAPKLAAKIVRHSDGYYLIPEKRGKVRLNSTTVSKPAKLHNGDEFVVRGKTLKFVSPASS
ncbi:MAG: FHA domain-containing protein [Gammaproteobacteria bacterium]